jgi:hypothetical protein
MQDIMDGKVAKVFMSILRNKLSAFFLALAVMLSNCSPSEYDDPVPYQPFPDIQLNLNLPEYFPLKTKGASKEIGGGIRGIIVYCQDVGVYRAFERNCSYHPNDACATVNVDNSKLFMIDPCCGSQFDFSTGNPTGGVAWRPLQRYQTSYDGVMLIITDQVVE